MNSFSISELSRYSGIKPHTIRIWEQRYNALTPNRTEGNTRFYDSSQLRRLLNIVSLMESDFKVSELCTMPDKKLFKLIAEFKNNIKSSEPSDYFVSQLIAAGMSYDEPNFEKIFSHCLVRFGIKSTYIKVIYPMLSRIGIMWASDSLAPANEHFIINIIRQKLFTAIDSLPSSKSLSDSWLLFLPENEFHEIGLLTAHYLIRLSGRNSIYLGSNVPVQSLTCAVNDVKPKYVLLFLVNNDTSENIKQYLHNLSESLVRININIYVACKPILSNQLKKEKKIHLLNSIEDLERILL